MSHHATHIHALARLSLALALSPAACIATAAQSSPSFPTKPIRLIVPFAPGGGTDFVGRLVAQKLSDSLGQPVVVDNRAGASGTIGADMVAKAPPDGYTIGMISAEHTIVAGVRTNMPFRLASDFAPVTQSTSQFYIAVVNPSVPAQSMKELIEAIRASAGRFNFGTSQLSVGHLAGELLKVRTGVQMTHIPYKGTGPALADLLGGRLSLMFSTLPPALPHVKAGKLRALAITAPQRSRLLPDMPTVAESGIPGFEATGWNGFLLPGRTPRPLVNRLQQEIARTLQLPDVQERYSRSGIEPVGSSPDEFGRLIVAELAKWGKVSKETGLQAND